MSLTATVRDLRNVTLEDLGLLNFGHSIQIAGVVFAQDGSLLLASFPDDRFDEDAAVDMLELSNQEWQDVVYQTDVLETKLIGINKALVRKSQRQIDASVSWAVFKRDGYRCRYCGKDGPLTVDHVDLWEAGGATVEENLLSACRKCNRTRGNMEYEAWVESEYYGKVSVALTEEQRIDNRAVVYKLPILRTLRTEKVRSR